MKIFEIFIWVKTYKFSVFNCIIHLYLFEVFICLLCRILFLLQNPTLLSFHYQSWLLSTASTNDGRFCDLAQCRILCIFHSIFPTTIVSYLKVKILYGEGVNAKDLLTLLIYLWYRGTYSSFSMMPVISGDTFGSLSFGHTYGHLRQDLRRRVFGCVHSAIYWDFGLRLFVWAFIILSIGNLHSQSQRLLAPTDATSSRANIANHSHQTSFAENFIIIVESYCMFLMRYLLKLFETVWLVLLTSQRSLA